MIVKLIYSGASAANIIADINTCIEGGITTSLDGSIKRPSNLNASSTESIVYGTNYANTGTVYNDNATGDHWEKKHNFYSGVTNWFSLELDSGYLSIQGGLNYADQTVKNTTLTSTGIVLDTTSNTDTYWLGVTDNIFYFYSRGSYAIAADLLKNGLNSVFTETTTFGIFAGGLTAGSGILPHTYDPEFRQYQEQSNLYLHSLGATKGVLSSSDSSVAYVPLDTVSVGTRTRGMWQVFGMRSAYPSPIFTGGGILQDSDDKYYFTTGINLYSVETDATLVATGGDTVTGNQLILEGE